MVIGLLVIGGLIIYLIVTLVLVVVGVRSARRRGKPGWKGGVLVVLIMYLLLFWDWIPMHVAHQYYCSSEGGFSRYKSMEQWKEENPGVAETLVPYKNVPAETANNRTRYLLNQRFAWDRYTTGLFLEIRKGDERIVDTHTGAILAQYIDFNSGQNQHNPQRFRDFKLWLWAGSCEVGDGRRTKPMNFEFNKFMFLVQHQREYE